MRKSNVQEARIAILPQEIAIDAPHVLVLEVITGLDLLLPSSTAQGVSRLSGDGSCSVVAFPLTNDPQGGYILKEMATYPPDRIMFRHLGGPFSAAIEEVRVVSLGDRTRLVWTAEFEADEASAARLLKLSFEHVVQLYLRNIKRTVEQRLRPLEGAEAWSHVQVPVPVATEEGLLAAVALQEEAEWGHVGHGRGVERVAVSLAEAVMLSSRQLDQLRRAALLHDVGKIALDSRLWGKRGTLPPEQRVLMEAHTNLGAELAARIGLPETVRTTILHHHERWDGTGYPDGLTEEEIPLRSRILFLAEAVDTMLRATYRRAAMSPLQVSTVLEAGAGRTWDPVLARKAARIVRGKPHDS